MTQLPFIDEHSREVSATPERTWQALLCLLDRSSGGGLTTAFVRLLGCQDTRPAGPRPLALGSRLPGFHIAEFLPPHRLSLAGRHRFSRYLLDFHLDPVGEGHTRLRVVTHAEFPGFVGRLYRLLVISSRLHVLVTRGILARVKTQALKKGACG